MTTRSIWKTLMLGVMVLAAAGATWAEDGLVLHWGFDEVQGQTVKDLSGKGNEGRIEGKVAWIPGVSGKAMLFDGDSGSVRCDDNASLNPSNITVMFWLSPKEWVGGLLICKGWEGGWGIDPYYGGPIVHFCANIGKQRTDTQMSSDIPLNRWTHLAVTYDGKQTAMYLDGGERKDAISGLVSGRSVVAGKVGGALNSSGWPLQVGGITPAVCYVDEVKIYNRALGKEEIKAVFEASKPAREGVVNDAILERLPGEKTPCEDLVVNKIPLVKARTANGIIVLDAQAPKITKYAVRELRLYLKKIFEVDMPVMLVDERTTYEAPELKGRNLILVGGSKVARELGFTAESLSPDGFRIGSKDNVLAIVGKDNSTASLEISGSVGSLYGVYRLLETMGVRWYFPKTIGEVLPTEKVVIVNDLKVTDAPYFIYRDAQNPPGTDCWWMRRIGFGGAVLPASSLHSFTAWAGKYSKNHPEYLSLMPDGGRGVEPCWYNPGARQQMIDDAEAYFKSHDPDLYPDFTMMRCDGSPPLCICPECRKREKPQEGFWGDRTDYVTEAAIAIAGVVKDKYPDRRIVIGAYENLTRPPVTFTNLPSNMSVHIAKSRLYVWSNEDKQRVYSEIIGGWLALKPATVSFWEYYNADCWENGKWFGVPCLATEMIASDIKMLKRMSEKSGIPFLGEMIFTDGRAGKDSQDRLYWLAPDLYITAKLLWHPELSANALMNEFYRLYFGPAEAPMKSFYKELEAVWSSGKWGRNLDGARMSTEEMKKAGSCFGANPWEVLFTPEILKELAGYLQKATEKAGKPPYNERVAMVVKQFGTTLKQAEKGGGKISAKAVW